MYPTYAPPHDPTAVIGRRIGAYAIDMVIGAVLLTIVMLAFATRESYTSTLHAQERCDALNNEPTQHYVCVPANSDVMLWKLTDLWIVAGIGAGYWVLNDAVLTGITGFSIGKGIVGLRVVRQTDGHRAGFGRSLGRWALWVVDGFPWCLPLVGLVTGLAVSGHRRVGDLVAGTFVVDKHQVGLPPQVPGVTTMMASNAHTGAFPTAGAPWGQPPGPIPGSFQQPWGAPPGSPGTPGAPPPWVAPPAAAPPWAAPTAAPPPWGAPPAAPPWGTPTGTPPAAPPWAAPPTQHPMPAPMDPTTVQSTVGDEPPTNQMPTIAPPMLTNGPGIDGPLWDDARDAYIQWDGEINRWVQWNESARAWHPI